MGVKKRSSLKWVLIKYMSCIVIGVCLSIMLPFFLLHLAFSAEIVNFANANEIIAQKAAAVIKNAEVLKEEIIPEECSYVILNKDFSVRKHNMEKDKLDKTMQYAKGQYIANGENIYFILVKREMESCVLQYSIGAEYRIEILNRLLPNPEQLMFALILLASITVCTVITARFVKFIKVQLKPLFEAADQIKNRNLDFDADLSGIKEFNEVIGSFMEMKTELKKSMEERWRMEKNKKEQMMALSHDLKTPLTIMRGNTELLSQTELTAEQEECVNYVLESTGQMEQYIRMLMDLSKMNNGEQFVLNSTDTAAFAEKLGSQVNALAVEKRVQVEMETQIDIPAFVVDEVLLERAVLNVVMNAIEHSPENGKVFFNIKMKKEKVVFTVEDFGSGFSKKDLMMAKKQFYMGESSRSSQGRSHYGMGLYIADTIAKLHSGQLILENNERMGAKVTLEIKV